MVRVVADTKQSEGAQPEGAELTTPIDDREDRHDEFASDSNTCPECGHAIENVRASCPNCGYLYAEGDYDDPDAGQAFVAGAQMDDEGKEVIDEQVEEQDDAEEDDDTSSSTSDSTSSGTSDPGDQA